MFKENPLDVHQRQLFATNVFDLLPEDHECFLFYDLCQQLDTTKVEAKYSIKGQNAYHPKAIVSIRNYSAKLIKKVLDRVLRDFS